MDDVNDHQSDVVFFDFSQAFLGTHRRIRDQHPAGKERRHGCRHEFTVVNKNGFKGEPADDLSDKGGVDIAGYWIEIFHDVWPYYRQKRYRLNKKVRKFSLIFLHPRTSRKQGGKRSLLYFAPMLKNNGFISLARGLGFILSE